MSAKFDRQPQQEEQETRDKTPTPSGPERSAEELAQIEKRRTITQTIDRITEDHQIADPEHSNIWSVIRQEWGPTIAAALKEPPQSVDKESPDKIDMIAYLAFRAFRRETPAETAEHAQEQDEQVKAINERGAQTQHMARKSMDMLLDRYKGSLTLRDLNRPIGQRAALEKVTRMIQDSDLIADKGHLLQSGLEIAKDDYERLIHLDEAIENISVRLAETSEYDIMAANDGEPGWQEDEERHKDQAGSVMPILKDMVRLRNAMSKTLFGSERTPTEVLAIQEKRKQAKE